jgi:hypothetical protein
VSKGAMLAYYFIESVGLVGLTAAAILGVFYVRRVSRALSPAALHGAP